MEFTEIKSKSANELKQLLADKRAELQNLRFQARGGQLKQNNKIDEVKKVIARILTVASNNKQQ